MYGVCVNCKTNEVPLDKSVSGNTTVTWFEWNKIIEEIKVTKNGEEEIRKVSKVKKEKIIGTVDELSKKFQQEMKKFCRHSFNISQQYAAYTQCRENLNENEALIHIDFSENYACKMAQEIQSYHFGGSRNQVTLHTGVAYIGGQDLPVSFCTVSSDRRHNPAAIWAHLEPVFKLIKKRSPQVEVLHFFSDGPTTQYRQKQNFYLFNNHLYYFGFKRATWSFFEAGHGKGAADGVGAALKRKADNLVAYGKDILDANQFFESVKESTNIKVFLIEEHDIDFIEQLIPADLPALKGTMKIHQLATLNKAGTLLYRDVSCFCGQQQRGLCSCFQYQKFQVEVQTKKNKKSKKNEKDLSDLESSFEFESENDSDDENIVAAGRAFQESIDETQEITPDKIIKGTYLLVEYLVGKRKKMKYCYIAVAQDNLEDDGEVRVMFLKLYDDSRMLYKIDDKDIAYINYDQIKKILPGPEMVQRGNRLFYKFPYSIDTFEK